MEGLEDDKGFIPFISASLQAYVETGQQTFTTTFVEFGEEFTTDYDVTAILGAAASIHINEAILRFESTRDQASFDALIQAYYYKVLVQLHCNAKNKTEESIFPTDIALTLLFTLLYFPEDAAAVNASLLRYLQEKEDLLNGALYNNLLGQSDVIPLAAHLLAAPTGLSPYIKEPVQPLYGRFGEMLYSEDGQAVAAWVNGLADYHIANSKDDWTLPFNIVAWRYFPVEIVAVWELRGRRGLDMGPVQHSLLAAFMPFTGRERRVPHDPFTAALRQRVIS